MTWLLQSFEMSLPQLKILKVPLPAKRKRHRINEQWIVSAEGGGCDTGASNTIQK